MSGYDHRLYIERLLIAAGIVILFLFLWAILDLVVLVLGAAVIAVLLNALAEPFLRWTPLGQRMAILVVLLLIGLTSWLLWWFFGPQLGSQFADLATVLPGAWHHLEAQIMQLPLGERLLDSMRHAVPSDTNFVGRLRDVALLIGNAVTDLLLIAFGAVFLAAQPRLYRRGLLKLLPPSSRELGGAALSDCSRALRLWLLGQLVSMTVVGLLTFGGLALVGVPSAAALGLIAGLLEIIPYAGPILGAVPGLLIAMLTGPEQAFWALIVYVVVQQLESNLLMPIIQRKAVELPPALTLFGIVAAGMIFGVVGFIFAAPVLVVVYVLVKRLYVREALQTPTPLPGDDSANRR